jgi:ubiquinone/menaquinone biosynthesis C-methylase UbiE
MVLELAKTRKCYQKVRVVDMNQLPLSYPDDSFDAVTCVGTVTYLEPAVLGEFVRITRSVGLVCYTNRTDKLEAWKEAETSQVQLKVVDISEPLPYLPGNIEFADKQGASHDTVVVSRCKVVVLL